MMIQPTGTPEPRAALVRFHKVPAPESAASQPSDSSQISKHSRLSAPGPLRPSDELRNWRQDYESRLGLNERALASRSSALTEGGPEMLYRMYPHLFQQDLQGPYQAAARLLPEKGPEIALTGDCHLGNFGTLRNQNRDLVWSLNDYDQVGKGSPESDLCRAGASFLLLCRQKGWNQSVASDLIETLTLHYSQRIHQYCENPPASVLGIHKDEAEDPVHGLIKKAERRTQEELLSKWTEMSNQGALQFKLGDDLHPLEAAQVRRVDQLLEELRLPSNVKILDRCCRWDAGGSSLGLERYYLLAQKEGESLPNVLELKQVLPCALATADPDPKQCDAQLLENGFGWLGAPKDHWQQVVRADNGVYLLRERQRARDALKMEKLDRDEAHKLAKQLGKVLAQAHAHGANPTLVRDWIQGREKQLAQNLQNFSNRYAAQMVQDFEALCRPK